VRRLGVVFAIPAFLTITLLSLAASPATNYERTLYTFTGGTFGEFPGELTYDGTGNLYGVSEGGIVSDFGMVFQLSSSSGFRVVYKFRGGKPDGHNPVGKLVMDKSGNLYGATSAGGQYGMGAVYELTPAGNGQWTETVLFSFGGGVLTDALNPSGGLIFDAAGNLYGVTSSGGTYYRGGTVYELSHLPGGGWSETVLYSFGVNSYSPIGSLVFDDLGNLYGCTGGGGIYHYGTVFELAPSSSGDWSESLLHSFGGSSTDGISPTAGVVFDSEGNLYGTTLGSLGPVCCGIVFELSKPSLSRNAWTETILYNFGNPGDGSEPEAAVSFDSNGNLYGSTEFGGAFGQGTVFRLTPQPDGRWLEGIYSFTGGTDGGQPTSGVVFDTAGHLYGTTLSGGLGYGVVFEAFPPSAPLKLR